MLETTEPPLAKPRLIAKPVPETLMRLQGCERSALAARRDDLHETPPEAARALLAVEPLPHKIWEPCAGRGAIVRELVRVGHEVCAMDLVARAERGAELPVLEVQL